VSPARSARTTRRSVVVARACASFARVSFEAVRRFAEVVQRDDDDIELDVAALLIGAWDNQDLDVARYRRTLDEIAAQAAAAIDAAASRDGDRPWAAPRALARTLFGELGFRGNAANYYDPRNSFLADVLDRRVGIPITLSVLYVEVARRVGIPARGVGFPGHFLVRVDGGPLPLILDPFAGGAELDGTALASLHARFARPDALFDHASLAPSPKHQILARMLHNLGGIYGRAGDLFRSIEILEHLAALDPSNHDIQSELDRLRGQARSLN
jgi:regulator of sirC expression with transglutaminase-like and TPR domain